jgi:hypothetical protein
MLNQNPLSSVETTGMQTHGPATDAATLASNRINAFIAC